jgi:hydrogenase-4 component E
MSDYTDLLLLVIIVLDLFIVSTSRILTCIQGSAIQGLALGLLPLSFYAQDPHANGVHVLFISAGTLLLKAVIIPYLLSRTVRVANVRREVEPFVSLHFSVLIAAALVGMSFWLSSSLTLPRPAASVLIVPAALSTLLIGFLVLVSRHKAITQVVGYLMIENGVFIFGQTLTQEVPFVVELGILLDVLVGVFVMGIAIYTISRTFDDIDTDLLASLKD